MSPGLFLRPNPEISSEVSQILKDSLTFDPIGEYFILYMEIQCMFTCNKRYSAGGILLKLFL